MKTGLAFIAMAVAAEAFVTPSSFAGSSLARAPSSSSSALRMAEKNVALETFDGLEESLPSVVPGGGFWFGSSGFWGEEDYRGFVDGYKSDNLINGVYPIVDRVRATKLLTITAESGLLSALEDAGLTLSEVEKLLPALEEAGLLSFAADKLDVLLNLFGFIAIEPAKLAIPAVVAVVKGLKGAGLLNLSSGDAVAVAEKPVKAARAQATKAVAKAKKDVKTVKSQAPKLAKQAASKAKKDVKTVKREAPKLAKKADSKAKKDVKTVKREAPKLAKKADSKAKKDVKTVKKEASKLANKADSKAKKDVKTVKQAATKAKQAVPKPVKKAAANPTAGNIANLPKAL